MPYFITLLQSTHSRIPESPHLAFLDFPTNFYEFTKFCTEIAFLEKKTKLNNLNRPQLFGHCGGRPTLARNQTKGKSCPTGGHPRQ
jgi:hypothetical protein